MAKTVLRLENYFFTTVEIRANKPFATVKESHPTEPKVEVGLTKHESDPQRFGLLMEIKVATQGKDIQPYEIEVAVFGLVRIPEDVPLNDRPRVAVVNGSHILYGALREFIVNLTARGPYGQVIIPPKSFSDYGPTNDFRPNPLRDPSTKRKPVRTSKKKIAEKSGTS